MKKIEIEQKRSDISKIKGEKERDTQRGKKVNTEIKKYIFRCREREATEESGRERERGRERGRERERAV